MSTAVLQGWNRRKSKIVNGSTSLLPIFQMQLNINWGSGTDTANVIYLGGNARTDFGDIRFTDSDGSTLLDYWIESYTSSLSAIIWVKVPNIPTSPETKTIYIYYDNPTQTTISNGPNTFPDFFDDFNACTLSSIPGWAIISEVNCVTEQIHAGGDVVNGFATKPFIESSGVWEFTTRLGSVGTTEMHGNRVGYTIISDTIPLNNGYLIWYSGARANNYVSLFLISNGIFTPLIASTITSDTNYHKIKVTRSPLGVFELFLDNIFMGTATDTTFTSLSSIMFTGSGGGGGWQKDFYSDWIFVRKFASPEPTFGASGLEEGTIPLIVGTSPQGADIILDGNLIGNSPGTFLITKGSHTLKLTKTCYEDIAINIDALPGDIITIDRIFTINTGALTINSTPPASIYVNGILQPNSTPYNVMCIPEGSYSFLLVLPNFQSYRGSINVVRNLTSTADIALLPLGAIGIGSISVISDPIGASITIDTQPTGQVTPLAFENIPIGSHAVILDKAGYQQSRTDIVVEQDVTTEVRVSLIAQTPTLRFFSTPTGAEILINDISQGVTTPTGLIVSNLNTGPLNFLATLSGHDIFNGLVSAISGVITDVHIPLSLSSPGMGSIYFYTDPPGVEIFIDGSDTGLITPNTISLPIGSHTYKLRLNGYRLETGNITILEGQTIIVPTILTPCVSIWTCESPLNGYESDGCGNRRTNSRCNPPVQAGLGGANLLLLGGLAVGALILLSKRERQTKPKISK